MTHITPYAERTFNAISDTNKILQKLEEVSIELENEMRKDGWAGKTVTLKYKLDTYQGKFYTSPDYELLPLYICFSSLHSSEIFRPLDYIKRGSLQCMKGNPSIVKKLFPDRLLDWKRASEA